MPAMALPLSLPALLVLVLAAQAGLATAGSSSRATFRNIRTKATATPPPPPPDFSRRSSTHDARRSSASASAKELREDPLGAVVHDLRARLALGRDEDGASATWQLKAEPRTFRGKSLLRADTKNPCACYSDSYLWDEGNGDCVNLWREHVLPNCSSMCSCYNETGLAYHATNNTCNIPASATGGAPNATFRRTFTFHAAQAENKTLATLQLGDAVVNCSSVLTATGLSSYAANELMNTTLNKGTLQLSLSTKPLLHLAIGRGCGSGYTGLYRQNGTHNGRMHWSLRVDRTRHVYWSAGAWVLRSDGEFGSGRTDAADHAFVVDNQTDSSGSTPPSGTWSSACGDASSNSTATEWLVETFSDFELNGTRPTWPAQVQTVCQVRVDPAVGVLSTCTKPVKACKEDPEYFDSDGLGCASYSTNDDDADTLCKLPGRTAALKHCELTCGTCWTAARSKAQQAVMRHLGRTNSQEIYLRLFELHPETSMLCSNVNDLGAPTRTIPGSAELDYSSAPIEKMAGSTGVKTGTGSREICARQCFRYRDAAGRHACKAFQFERDGSISSNGAAVGWRCRFSSSCNDVRALLRANDTTLPPLTRAEASKWDSYLLPPLARMGCDGQLFSPLVVDSCGVCGGDNSTCSASLTLLYEDEDEDLPTAQRDHRTVASLTRSRWLKTHADTARAADHEVGPTSWRDGPSGGDGNGPSGPRRAAAAHAYLRLYGSRGSSQDLAQQGRMRSAVAAPDIPLRFARQDKAMARWSMAFPHSHDLGKLQAVALIVVGGQHWLSMGARRLLGVRLTMTIAEREREWVLRLQSPVDLDETRDVITLFDWVLPASAAQHEKEVRPNHSSSGDHDGGRVGFHPSVVRCEQDCSPRSTSAVNAAAPLPSSCAGDVDSAGDTLPCSGPWPPLQRGCVRLCKVHTSLHYRMDEADAASSTCLQSPTGECSRVWAPVCSADGRTYPNRCVADAMCAHVIGEGTCEEITRLPLGAAAHHLERTRQALAVAKAAAEAATLGSQQHDQHVLAQTALAQQLADEKASRQDEDDVGKKQKGGWRLVHGPQERTKYANSGKWWDVKASSDLSFGQMLQQGDFGKW